MPPAVVDILETGRVDLFSRQFLEGLPQRFTGPERFRFVLQPTLASLAGVRGSLADAEAGNPPYLFGLLFDAERRRELLRHGAAAVRTLLGVGIILDVVFQLLIYHGMHPSAAVLVGPIPICVPYALPRALAARLARSLGRREQSIAAAPRFPMADLIHPRVWLTELSRSPASDDGGSVATRSPIRASPESASPLACSRRCMPRSGTTKASSSDRIGKANEYTLGVKEYRSTAAMARDAL
jgi:hypothetical protein